MKARCKFTVKSVTWEGPGHETITLTTLYDPDDPEDTRFSLYTPMGDMEFGLSNPNLVGTFKPGDVYYVDLTPVEEERE